MARCGVSSYPLFPLCLGTKTGLWKMQALISVAYIHHVARLPARSLQTTIVSPRYEPYHCQLMTKLSHGHDLLQWCSHTIFVQDLQCGTAVCLFSLQWFTLALYHSVVGVLLKRKSSIYWLSFLSVAVLSLFGLGAISCVNLPQHRPRNVRLCCCPSPSIVLGHCQREGIKITRMKQRSWRDYIQFILECKNKLNRIVWHTQSELQAYRGSRYAQTYTNTDKITLELFKVSS